MVNNIGGGVSDIKVDKAVQLSLSSYKGQTIQNESQTKTASNDQMLANSFGNTPDVSVIINGQEKNQPNDGKKEITTDDAKEMTEALNDFMDKLNCNIQFKYHEKLDLLTIQMINKKTKEVIKEFPPEEILKTMEKTQEWIGIFLDKKA